MHDQRTSASQERPAPDSYTSWPDYWKSQGVPWRTEPEIDGERQLELDHRRREIAPDIEKGIYPFKDIKLDRADVEWLLATQESGGMRGPVDWSDLDQREREGLDLRGIDLRGVNLSGLPLARLVCGFTYSEWLTIALDQDEASAAHLEAAILRDAHLEGAVFGLAHCERVDFRGTNLESAILGGAHLEGADFSHAHMEVATLGAARLQGAYLNSAHLEGADLRLAFFDETTRIDKVVLGNRRYGFVSVADVRWDGLNLAVVEWEHVTKSVIGRRRKATVLGDEKEARNGKDRTGKRKDKHRRLRQFSAAVRANRQLAMALRQQGLNEDADYFAYRARTLQRQVLRRQGHPFVVLGSLFLDLVSGYGYRPLRSLYTYIVIISVFALLYWWVTNGVSLTFGWFTYVITWLGMSPPPPSTVHLQGYEAVVVSMTSFHGRGFFQPIQTPGDKVAILAAIEAFFGLLLEIVLIATFTQRFFAR
jgi:uncharacterized protein YjbI with pentapeptide repeats